MTGITRRQLFGATAGAAMLRGSTRGPKVAVERCRTYQPDEVLDALRGTFDAIDIGRIVRGKTITVKVNMTGNGSGRQGYTPIESTIWTHPNVICASLYLMERAGARRFRIVESPWKSNEPLEEHMLRAGWEPRDFLGAAKRVEFENTNFLGYGDRYHRLDVPGGGMLFPAYDLNHAYVDCDAFVSIAKMKEHVAAAITLTIKNCFGITPCTIYGDSAGADEPDENPLGGRGSILHRGLRQPTSCSPPELDPSSPRHEGYRVPRCIVDLIGARPVDLAIIDGVRGQAYAMGNSGFPVDPGLLIAGDNPVSVDAVGTALMGYDPMAERGEVPFEQCDSTLQLGEAAGFGTRNLDRIELAGLRIEDAAVDYRSVWLKNGKGPLRQPRRRRR
jgi:uncharacterized protein (DUF362 family)